MLKEHQFEVGQITLNCAVTGAADATPIILLHGVTHRWQAFDETIPALADDYRVYAVDLRGHGESGRVPGGYQAIDYAPDILALARGVSGLPVILIGHSLGALVALQVAAELGPDARALVLMEPPLFYTRKSIASTPWHEMFERTYRLVKTATSAEEIEAKLRERLPEAHPGVLKGMAGRLYRLDPQVLGTLMGPEFIRDYDLTGFLGRVACPTLLLQSDPEVNSVLEDQDVALVQQHVNDCRHVVIREAMHTMHFSHPQRVNATIVGFLQG